MVGWALGEYLWQVVADAAEQLGGGPVGAEALADHRRETMREIFRPGRMWRQPASCATATTS